MPQIGPSLLGRVTSLTVFLIPEMCSILANLLSSVIVPFKRMLCVQQAKNPPPFFTKVFKANLVVTVISNVVLVAVSL